MKYYPLRKIGKILCNITCGIIPNDYIRRLVRNSISPLGAGGITRYCAKHYLPKLLAEHDYFKSKPKSGEQEYIFQAWFQGLENAPEIVKKCIASVEHFKGNRKHVIITDDNLLEWCHLPDYIVEKYRAGIIDRTHFSDIIRLALLAEYGGYWIDATCLMTADFDKDVDKLDLFLYNSWGTSLFYTLIQSCFIRARAGHPLVCAWRDMIYQYWKEENQKIHYFLVHFMFKALLYDKRFKSMFDEMPFVPFIPTHRISFEGNKKYDKDLMDDIFEGAFWQKLAWGIKKEDVDPDTILGFVVYNDLDYILKSSPR